MNSITLEGMIHYLSDLVDVSGQDVYCSRAPGRIEVLGNHTDYNAGFVLAATIDRYIWSVGTLSERTTLYALDMDESLSVDPIQIVLEPDDTWQKYVKGVLWALARRGYDFRSVSAVVHGNIPIGGGLSSSAALEVSLLNLISALNGLRIRPKSAAMLAFEAERVFCGISCGVMDQFSSQLGKSDALLGIDCRSMHTYDIPFEFEASFVVIDSMVSREASDVLNRRRSECIKALNHLQESGWDIHSLSEVSNAQLVQVDDILDETESDRVRHIVMENARVKEGAAVIKEGDLARFGELMKESHASSRDLYEVSHPNLDLLVESSSRIDGVLGARMSGAGLGGNIIALVKERNMRTFMDTISREYESQTGNIPTVTKISIPGGVTTRQV